MTSTDITPAEQREPYANRPNRIDKLTPRVRKAVDLMIWDALPFDEAATKAGLTVHAMRLALAKPHVVAYLKQQQQVLRGSEGPRSIHRIRQIRDAAENKPALDAAMWFVADDEQQQRQSGASASPGVTIRVVTVVQQATPNAPHMLPSAPVIDASANAINGLGDECLVLAGRGSPDHAARPSDGAPAVPQSAPRGGRGEN